MRSTNTLQLTARDLDEAGAGLLTKGQVATDVNGSSVQAGFTRIHAYRIGLTGSQDRCCPAATTTDPSAGLPACEGCARRAAGPTKPAGGSWAKASVPTRVRAAVLELDGHR